MIATVLLISPFWPWLAGKLQTGAIYGITLLVVLGVLVFVHEFGHFAVAKLFGVRVEQFALGFGKRLFGVRRGGTDYRVNLLPLGGYVKMAGENPFDNRSTDPAEFMNKPRWQRFFIAIAGPAMNILMAIALLAGLYMVHYRHADYVDQPVVIGAVEPNSPAAQAGLQPGDRIVRLASKQNPTWTDAVYEIALDAGQPLDIAVQRGQEILVKKIVPAPTGPDHSGSIGILPARSSVVTAIDPGSPAASAGFQLNDEIVAINGEALREPEDLISTIQKTGGHPIQITLLRDSQPVNVSLTPYFDNRVSPPRYRLGVGTNEKFHIDKLPFTQAVAQSVADNKRGSGLLLTVVERLFQGRAKLDQLSGPLAIGQATGQQVIKKDWASLIEITAMISLQLGIINLFPFPIMDGGVVLFLLIESIMRRDISLRIKERVYQAAFVLIVLFFVVVMYNDLSKMIPGMGRP
jgi:regulator of sigma E protease